jgi:SAM-dependent methyltransferase
MTTAQAGIHGDAPKIVQGKGNPEALKYGQLWERDEYRKSSPGESFVPLFSSQARPASGATVIDFGCGTGRGARLLAADGLKVTLIDFVNNCLDPDIRKECETGKLKFIKADLEQRIPVVAEYGYCTDVMEHIPTARVDRVLANILDAAQHVFFAICTTDDEMGKLIDEKLHLTVQEYGWWLSRFAQHDCIIHWSRRLENYSFFYVTAWKPGRDVVKSGKLNAAEEQIRENVKRNIAQGWEQVIPHQANYLECMILGGGPSLNEFADDIKLKRADGVKLLTLNGAYHWALERELVPSAQIVVDARPFNSRFTRPVIDDCKYLIGSQCDPSVLEGLPKDRTFLWHSNPKLVDDLLNAQYDLWYSIPGGSSVLLRTIPLMRMLGYRKFYLYGCDSCLMDQKHHAFSQPENDGAYVLPVIVNPGGRVFRCHPWMVSQAQEFIDLIRVMGDEVELEIYGDGLLAHILNTGAEITIEEGAN